MRILMQAIVLTLAAWGQNNISSIVTGRVVNILREAASGVAIDGHQLSLNVDGTFRVTGLKPGTHLLEAAAPGYKRERLEFDLESGQDLQLPSIEVQVANFACGGDLHPGRKFIPRSADRGNIVGDVSVGDGLRSPVVRLPGVEVSLDGIKAIPPVLTDSEGRYRFERLPPGAYTVIARRRGFYETRIIFKVEARFESNYFGYIGLTLCLDGTCKMPRPAVPQGCE